MSNDPASDDEPEKVLVKNATDLQRLKIEKLMKNPEKPVYIPEGPRNKKFPDAPEFVRNVMGSSAGAGSGEFHVYRHIRRREYGREEYLNKIKEHDRLDNEYADKLEVNKREAEEKTAKKRAKRQKRKEKLKKNKKMKGNNTNDKKDSDSGSESESDTER